MVDGALDDEFSLKMPNLNFLSTTKGILVYNCISLLSDSDDGVRYKGEVMD